VRIARFAREAGEVSFGLVDGLDGDAPTSDSVIAPITGHPFEPPTPTGEVLPLAAVRLLAPVLPSKVIAFGRNYVEHARELGNEVPAAPMFFLKPSTSVIGTGAPIVLPWQSQEVSYEAELAVVIGRLCRDVAPEDAASVILGYTCANDVTARDLQRTDGQWSRAKGFDSFCPLGPWISVGLDVTDVRIRCEVDGSPRQDGSTALMVRGVPDLVAYASAAMTLLPGDVILTGTPAGVGPLEEGQRVDVSIDGIGRLVNPVVARG
jgi:2-keto-4-pentenoate hydratase/2-oxohepta-3-ene-1,7-dioic acid hydratase in catechol pathway